MKDHAGNITNSPYCCPSVPLEKASHSLCRQGHLVSLEAPKVLARGFKGQSYQDRSSGARTSDVVQAVEKAAAPFALKLFFFPCHFMGLLCFPWEYLTIFFGFFSLELAGFALRVTAPLLVLAVSEMVLCSLSVGSLLLNAASGTPEHLDQSIGLSQPYFAHCPHPRDVCDSQRERTRAQGLLVTEYRSRPGCFSGVLAPPELSTSCCRPGATEGTAVAAGASWPPMHPHCNTPHLGSLV